MEPDSFDASESSKHSLVIAARHFLIGVFLGGVPTLAYLWLSVDMTYGSWAAVGTGRVVGAIAVPFLCGSLAAALGRKMINFLSAVVEGVQLPF